jgi:4-hydroxy-4-methyl-2-oxoglutarate aldolase
MASPLLTPEQWSALSSLDTCTVANTIETFNVRLRNEGFMDASVRCLTLQPKPLVAYAATLRVQCSHPLMPGRQYLDQSEWWNWLANLPKPTVLVIEDVDERPGTGALIGEIHSAILQTLGCLGVVTNGAVRDLPAAQKMGFHLFAGSVAVSHAYAHMVDFGHPAEMGGLKVNNGDLLHADVHGVLSVPLSIAAEIPAAAQRILTHEDEILKACHAPDATIEKIRKVVTGYLSPK